MEKSILCPRADIDAGRILNRIADESKQEWACAGEAIDSIVSFVEQYETIRNDGFINRSGNMLLSLLRPDYGPISSRHISDLTMHGQAIELHSVSVRDRKYSRTVRAIMARTNTNRMILTFEMFAGEAPLTKDYLLLRYAKLRLNFQLEPSKLAAQT